MGEESKGEGERRRGNYEIRESKKKGKMRKKLWMRKDGGVDGE